MSEGIIIGLIGFASAVAAAIISARAASGRVLTELQKWQAVTDERLDRIDKKVDEHNGYAKMFHEAIPVIKEKIEVGNHRISDLEQECRELKSYHMEARK